MSVFRFGGEPIFLVEGVSDAAHSKYACSSYEGTLNRLRAEKVFEESHTDQETIVRLLEIDSVGRCVDLR